MTRSGIYAIVDRYDFGAFPSPKGVAHGAVLHDENVRVARSVISPLGLSNLATHYPILVLDNVRLGHTLELVHVLKT